MTQMDLSILGYVVKIHYNILSDAVVEWRLMDERDALLNMLLKVHYTDYIEAAIKENWFYRNWYESTTNIPDYDRDPPF